MRLILLLFLLPVLNGCISPARSLERSAVALIKEGSSSRVEIEKNFGKPFEVTVGSNNKTVAEYRYVLESPPFGAQGPQVHFRTLSLLYNQQEVVEKLIYNESTRTIERRVTGVTIGSAIGRPDWIVKGKTPSASLIQHYGPADSKIYTPEGELLLRWLYWHRQRGNELSAVAQEFTVLVDQDGTVLDYQTRAATVPRISP